MDLWQAILLGVVEGLTEFLPVSSTGHLTLAERLLGWQVDDPGLTAFTAVIQLGAIAAVLIFFWSDITRLAAACGRGLVSSTARRNPDYRLAWYIIAGSLPIAVVGVLARHLITGPLRSLWAIVVGLLAWSLVMAIAERVSRRDRGERDLTLADSAVIGAIQCFALLPGVSRSGATISGGLMRHLDRLAATRVSFLLGIPALLAAGLFEGVSEASAISTTVGWVPTATGIVVSFVVAYAAVAWLLRFVSHHPITVFIWYRVALGVVLAGLLLGGVVSAN
ncbi:MAG: undecaprenyl-diphosphate phosphatase [Propionibacteriaceae bacterium]|jgi:undecaprenyl-diphosphatase|nr:undecaprenyl-diphosphate phosphatase [Propionibacteriaceae bacterium]